MACRALLLAAAAAAVAAPARAYYHHRGVDFGPDTQVYMFSEGPMFATGEGPFGSSADSYVSLAALLTQQAEKPASTAIVNVAFFSDANAGSIGVRAPGAAEDSFPDICCTRDVIERGDCDNMGDIIIRKDRVPAGVPMPETARLPMTGRSLQFNRTHVVRHAGYQWALVAVCDTILPGPVRATAQFEYAFHNPYGYLPGLWYALLPFYGVLAAVYATLLLVYAVVFVRNRAMLLPLQYCILAVIVMGVTESCAYLFMYLSKNDTGVAPCCPVTGDYLAAVVLGVMKTTISRVLLLAVCLGFGVVRPRLERRVTAAVVLLGLAYFVCSTTGEIRRASTTELTQSVWDFLVLLANFAFLFWIYVALLRVKEELKAARQPVKLQMYAKLTTTLQAFVAAWVVLSVFMILIASGIVPVPWRALWVVQAFWDVLYLGILVAIAVIWAPSERAMQYALYSQPAADEGGAEGAAEAEMVGLPAGAGAGGRGGGGGGGMGRRDSGGSGSLGDEEQGRGRGHGDGDGDFRLAGSDDEDEDEVEVEVGVGARPDAAATATARAASSTAGTASASTATSASGGGGGGGGGDGGGGRRAGGSGAGAAGGGSGAGGETADADEVEVRI